MSVLCPGCGFLFCQCGDRRKTELELRAELAAERTAKEEALTKVVELETALAAIPARMEPNGVPISHYEHLARCASRSLREREEARELAEMYWHDSLHGLCGAPDELPWKPAERGTT